MGCDPITFPDGTAGFICSRSKHPGSRTKCSACGTVGSPVLCDGSTPTPGKTCDAPLCRKCASNMGGDWDLCPWCVNRARSARRVR